MIHHLLWPSVITLRMKEQCRYALKRYLCQRQYPLPKWPGPAPVLRNGYPTRGVHCRHSQTGWMGDPRGYAGNDPRGHVAWAGPC